jgi:hypothetical protein
VVFLIKVQICQSDHPAYNAFSLFANGNKGIGVIQQRYDPRTKTTWWGPVDKDNTFYILHSPFFEEWWNDVSRPAANGLYHVVELRKVMWALHIKPSPKEPWETKF